ncbi:MAG: hypothetical protein RR548_02790 [Carnobacterium sp.]|uniref:Uncharacterized protein n=1 Tax=Carnobacterium antarcticum TaxID=2126436 RepID=A0ABW4NNZ0_9LACT|nr:MULTISPECIES: hypothetical protein [unclassified Carnobacterium]ALV22901.1 hypothetical protein NY10_2316 [Carnobacterium sp. CP1]QQP70791.1 hypothetical protein JHE06_03090 [Carnobacterium sp. CS13]
MNHSLSKVEYAYIIEGKDAKNILTIAKEDLIENADGVLDCPLDGVLRRHNLSLTDLNSMGITRLSFVKIVNKTTIILRNICLNVNF